MASSLRELNLDPFGQQPQRIPIYRDEPEFVDRVRNNQNYPVINNPDGSVSTHRMAAESDANGNWYVFPTIQMQDGELVEYYDSRDAMDAAFKTGNILRAPNKQSALNYAEGAYKRDTGLGDRPVSTLRGLQELSPSDPLYIHQDPMPAGADIMTQQEAISELTQREESARVAGTVSPFQSSFNPFNPNFRATAQNAISNMLGGSNISSNPNYLQGRIANTLSGLVDFIPAVGDAVGVGDTMTSYRQGDMLGTGINALAAGVGVLPLVGGPASKAVKAGGNRVRSALRNIDPYAVRMARAQEQGYFPVYHGSTHNIKEFDLDKISPEGYFGKSIYTTTSPKDASINYAGEGPDLTNTLDRRAEEIIDSGDLSIEWSNLYKKHNIGTAAKVGEARNLATNELHEIAKDMARKELIGDAEAVVYPLMGRSTKTFDTSVDGSTYLEYKAPELDPKDYLDEAGGNMDVAYDLAQEAAYDFEPEGELVDFFESLRNNPYLDKNDFSTLQQNIMEESYDGGISAKRLDEIFRNSNIYPEDDAGNLMNNEVFRKAIEDSGFDTIIQDTDVFSSMDIPKGTKHKIFLKPNQLRSTNAEFDPTKADSSDLLSSISPTQSSLRNIA